TEGGLVDLEELGIPAIAGEKGVWARHAIAATIAARCVTIREQIRRDMGPPWGPGRPAADIWEALPSDSAPNADFGSIYMTAGRSGMILGRECGAGKTKTKIPAGD